MIHCCELLEFTVNYHSPRNEALANCVFFLLDSIAPSISSLDIMHSSSETSRAFLVKLYRFLVNKHTPLNLMIIVESKYMCEFLNKCLIDGALL